MWGNVSLFHFMFWWGSRRSVAGSCWIYELWRLTTDACLWSLIIWKLKTPKQTQLDLISIENFRVWKSRQMSSRTYHLRKIAIVTQLLLLFWTHKNSWRFNFSLSCSIPLYEVHCWVFRGFESNKDPHSVILFDANNVKDLQRVVRGCLHSLFKFSAWLEQHFQITFCNKLFSSFLRFDELMKKKFITHYTIECGLRRCKHLVEYFIFFIPWESLLVFFWILNFQFSSIFLLFTFMRLRTAVLLKYAWIDDTWMS